ncbi:VOC family protein [Halobacillus salinarum]|uniref:VOC family protein n=1 Tax=Halobacillus salinarum TaxID=2932257 RepID=A0ABY4EP56_9BACI|nr:VOC family protein [Halobacillus salinarum]UOQ43856.1 VOC family protein [Halobacillus salinarum]
MAKLTPYLFSSQAREQADFYINALGGEILSIQTYDEMPDAAPDLKGKVMHLVFEAGGVQFYIADAAKGETNHSSIELVLEYPTVNQARSAFDQLKENGRTLMPFEKMFWGSYFGRLEDPYGIRWQIASESQ